MDIVKNGNVNLRAQIWEPDFTYDFHNYLIEENGYIYNAITGEIVRGVDIEKDKEELINSWFMLPTELEPKSMLYYIRQARLNMSHHLPTNDYTIFTTMNCNAGCYYCFQHGGNGSFMNLETARAVAEYIYNNCDRSKRVNLRWFGGEPLLNQPVINYICEFLRVRNIYYYSSMSSNGDLFDVVDDGDIYHWNLRAVQFTIDRTGSDYDKDKGLPDGAYERLKETVERFARIGVGVQIRLHYHPEYGMDVAKEVANEFSEFKNVYMYPAMIYDEKRSKEDYEALTSLESYIMSLGILRFGFDDPSKNSYCMADSDHSRCIRVDGTITPCEHYSEGETLGNVYSDDLNMDVLEKWREKRKYRLGCIDCPLYPACEILENCPSCGICEDGYKEYRVERIKRGLRELGGSNV